MASNFEPDEELSEIITRMWEMDENRCEPGVDYELDLQGYVTSAREIRQDWADGHLFSWVDEERVFEKDTYKAFKNLLDNYESETGLPEDVTQEEINENCLFIDLLMDTAVMQEVHQVLVSKGKAPEDTNEFKQKLYSIWFKLYRRTKGDRDYDSCGFEHVFVGETRGRSVIGFHNWIQIYLQEKRGNVDYKGYFRRGTSDEEHPRFVTIQFTWKKYKAKPIGSSFIGTSPEFEVALYTLVRLMDKGSKIHARIADLYDVEVTCYPLGMGIGTAYPVGK